MLDDKDIQKLIEVFATREEVATKQDLEVLRKDFSVKLVSALVFLGG